MVIHSSVLPWEVSRTEEPGGLQSMGSLLLWSVDPRDWAVHDAAAVEAAVISQVQDGDVILLHDLSDSSVDAALAIVDKLQKEGFRFVTVSRLAEIRGVRPRPGAVYKNFPTGEG